MFNSNIDSGFHILGEYNYTDLIWVVDIETDMFIYIGQFSSFEKQREHTKIFHEGQFVNIHITFYAYDYNISNSYAEVF